MKKIVTLIVILALALAIPVSTVGADFPDVRPGHWAFVEISEMTERGILNGYPDGTLRPEKTVTRAEIAKMLVLASGLDATPTSAMSFTDVSDEAWYHPYVESVKDYLHGYTQGGQSVFSPNAPARREEVAEALVLLKGYSLSGVDTSAIQALFSDYDSISGSARLYVAVAVEKGLIRGYPDGTFRARGSITRAESVAMLCRAFPIPVTGISGIPTSAAAGTPLPLTGTVIPHNSTNKKITWSVVNDRGTNAAISGNTLNTASAGTVSVRATIADGIAIGIPYIRDVFITVEDENTVHISTAEELSAIGGPQSEGKIYVLDNDVHLTSEWMPIDEFRGTFDGGGHAISNLFVLESSNRQFAGLFGSTREDAFIINVGVIIGSQGVSASYLDYGQSSAGGLVGYAGDGTEIHNCYVTGNGPVSYVGVDITMDVGGLVGVAYDALVTNCYSTVNVNIAMSNINMMYPTFAAGGLIGRVGGTAVERSSATGSVYVTVATSEYMMEQMAQAEDNFIAATYAGGLFGVAIVNPRNIEIVNCFAMGSVTVSSDSHIYSGGLIGAVFGWEGNVDFEMCYATGDVYTNNSEHSYAGGLLGGVCLVSGTTCTDSNSYRLDTQSVFGKHIDERGTVLTSSQMQSAQYFPGWDFDNTWGFREGENNGYPIHMALPA